MHGGHPPSAAFGRNQSSASYFLSYFSSYFEAPVCVLRTGRQSQLGWRLRIEK